MMDKTNRLCYVLAKDLQRESQQVGPGSSRHLSHTKCTHIGYIA